jgi:hypothetical protein
MIAEGIVYSLLKYPEREGLIRYSLINRVSVRYGSSAQYFWSGAQVFMQNVLDAENNTKVDQLAQLGGNGGSQAVSGFNCAGQTAYVYLKLPHNSCRAAGKPLPFPSDLKIAAAAA